MSSSLQKRNTVCSTDKNWGSGVTQTGVARLWTWESRGSSVMVWLKQRGEEKSGGRWDWRGKQQLHHGGVFVRECCLWIIIFLYLHLFSPHMGKRNRRGSRIENQICAFHCVTLGKPISVSLITLPSWGPLCTHWLKSSRVLLFSSYSCCQQFCWSFYQLYCRQHLSKSVCCFLSQHACKSLPNTHSCTVWM